MAKCDNCGKEHTRRRFCSNRCKDRFHNRHNPRGLALIPAEQRQAQTEEEMYHAGMDGLEVGWDGHKNVF